LRVQDIKLKTNEDKFDIIAVSDTYTFMIKVL